jgi:hypothetical protein
MANITTIKSKIKEKLDALVTAGTLGAAESLDLRKDPLDGDIVGYPHAFLMPPSVENAGLVDNRTLRRTYTFAIMVLMKAENLASVSDVEVLMEAIMNKFDNSVNLDNESVGGIEAVTSTPAPIQHGDKQLIVFDVIIKARAIYDLSYA